MDDIKKIKRNNKKKILFLLLTIITFLGISLGAIYFIYVFNDTRDNELATGLISIDFSEGNGVINLENQVPVIDEVGLTNTPYEFTVKNTSVIPINLKIELEPQSDNTINLGAVRYAFYIDNQLIEIGNVDTKNDNTIYLVNNFQPGATINGKLIFWVDYYYETPGEKFSAKIKVTGESFDILPPEVGSDKIKKAIAANTDESCTPYVEEDGIIYLSGDNTCVDFNYVWYSGKLWRITAIYPDGTMKMITDNNITSIGYGTDYNFYTDENTNSWIYQWLNEDFLDTLYNHENIVEESSWNATVGNGSINYKLPETTMVNSKVGLLNSYEYYLSYKNTSYSSGYLSIGYFWWLLNRYNATEQNMWWVDYDGKGFGYPDGGNQSEKGYANGVRPSIILKSTIQLLGGLGTVLNPYTIKGDKEEIVANVTLLNTRSSGEYVNVNNELFRIVSAETINEKLTTKLNKVDYLRDTSDAIMTKKFASTTTYGKDTNTQNDDYWDYYLNNTWLKEFDNTYNEIEDTSDILVKGIYYTKSSSNNYKTAICVSTNNNDTIVECEKTTENWSGYVGLPRYGEMFASQQGSGYSTSSQMFLITPYSMLNSHILYNDARIYYSRSAYAVRPSINLKSTVVIKSGSGTKQDPFVVGLPS